MWTLQAQLTVENDGGQIWPTHRQRWAGNHRPEETFLGPAKPKTLSLSLKAVWVWIRFYFSDHWTTGCITQGHKVVSNELSERELMLWRSVMLTLAAAAINEHSLLEQVDFSAKTEWINLAVPNSKKAVLHRLVGQKNKSYAHNQSLFNDGKEWERCHLRGFAPG